MGVRLVEYCKRCQWLLFCAIEVVNEHLWSNTEVQSFNDGIITCGTRKQESCSSCAQSVNGPRASERA